MCVESDGCEMEGCSSSDEVRTLSGSMSPAGLKPSPDLHPCKPGHKFRAALLRCRSPIAAAGILSFGNVLNYMDRYTVAGKTSASSAVLELREGCAGVLSGVGVRGRARTPRRRRAEQWGLAERSGRSARALTPGSQAAKQPACAHY